MAVLQRTRVGIAVATAFALGGCAEMDPDAGVLPARGPATVRPAEGDGLEAAGGTVRRIEGDWDDAEAAVDIAVTQSQCGFLAWESDKDRGDARRWYRLLTIREEEGELELRREGDGPARAHEAVWITVRCRIGPRGDANYERMVIDRVAARFAQLRGDRTAPIANPWGINQ